MPAYNHNSTADRQTLARELTGRLARGGLERIFPGGTREAVYEKKSSADPRLAVRVYTSCDHGEARTVGTDAIRVCLVYHCANGAVRGIAKERRVNRTGDIAGIIDRTISRIADLREVVPTVARCTCGAPKFVSKSGNLVCSDLCWLR